MRHCSSLEGDKNIYLGISVVMCNVLYVPPNTHHVRLHLVAVLFSFWCINGGGAASAAAANCLAWIRYLQVNKAIDTDRDGNECQQTIVFRM